MSSLDHSEENINDMIFINDEVWGPKFEIDTIPSVFVYMLKSKRGCMINHVEKGSSVGPINFEWTGGWSDICSGGTWDYAGRAIKYKGDSENYRLENLPAPKYTVDKYNRIIFPLITE